MDGSGLIATSRHPMRAPEPERWTRGKLEILVTMPWSAMFEDGEARADGSNRYRQRTKEMARRNQGNSMLCLMCLVTLGILWAADNASTLVLLERAKPEYRTL